LTGNTPELASISVCLKAEGTGSTPVPTTLDDQA